MPAAAPEDRTLRAYSEYLDTVRKSFEDRARHGHALFDGDDTPRTLADGHVVVQGVREQGIVGIPGGLIHHWWGVALVPDATVGDAIAVSQNYGNYPHVYKPIVAARLLENDGDRFRVLLRIEKSRGTVSAVLDVWSRVQYQWHGGHLVYSESDSERIAEVENAGTSEERWLSPDQGRGYLWRASAYSRFAERDDGLLVEFENVGLSRTFPPMLGWFLKPIARHLGRGSVEDSLLEFREAVRAAHRTRVAAAAGR